MGDRLIVEVLNLLPGDSFPNVLFLLSLQGELNKELLELLVDIVDAKLFETVILGVKKGGRLRQKFQSHKYPEFR